MRREFSQTIEKIAFRNQKIIFLTGDLGFMALENIGNSIKNRFINAGVSEQNMMAMAAGMASEKLIPICYSIAPFAVFRPSEQIRLDIALHNMNVKIVGNGGGYGYGIMGATHHAIEDIAHLSSLQNMKCFIPFCNEDVEQTVHAMMTRTGPSYLRLGHGQKPPHLNIPAFASFRKVANGSGVTIASTGPVVLNALKALESLPPKTADVFVISEMPLVKIAAEFKKSLFKTKKLLVVEEHVSRGGLGENLSILLAKKGADHKLVHLCASGYPSGLYGSQSFHQKESRLDPDSILKIIKKMV